MKRLPSIGIIASSVLLALRIAQGSTQIPGSTQQQPIVIVNATLHPIASPTIQRGTILFDQGRIVSMGDNVDVPAGAEQIDGQGHHVYPGLFCAGGQLGLVEVNSVRATIDGAESGNLNPNVRAHVAVNPDSELIPVTRSNGVLFCLSVPNGGMISGMSAVIQLDGWTWEEMTLKPYAGLHVQWPRMRTGRRRSQRGSGREQAAARDEQLRELGEFFDRAEQHQRGRNEDAVDVRYDSLVPVHERTVPLIVSADSQRQIESAVAFAAKRNLRLVLYGGYDAPECAPLLREHQVPVIIPAVYRLPQRPDDPFDAPYTLPHRLHKAGIRFCIAGVDRFAAANLRNLPYHAATAVAYGLDTDEAIRAITLSPAEILGVADRIGSLEVGKDASVIVTDGDPLDTTTQVLVAFVQGRRVDLSNRQHQLWQKYQEKYRRLNAAQADNLP